MGLVDQYVLGRSVLPTVITEVAFDDETEAHAASDSFKFMSYSVTPDEEREMRRDVRQSRQDISVMLRNRTNEANSGLMFLPRGLAVPPDGGAFWEGLLGTETIGGSDVTYSNTGVQPPSLSMIVSGGDPNKIIQEKVTGWAINEGTITLAQGEEPRAEFTGPAAKSIIARTTLIVGAATSATQTVTPDQANQVEVGSIMEVVGAGTDLRVIARDLTADTITFDSSITTTGGEIVRPFTPFDESTTNQGGEPIASFDGAITIGGVTTHCIIGGTITVRNNWTEVRKQFSQTIVDVNPGHQEVEGTLNFNARELDLQLLLDARQAPDTAPGTVNPVAVVLTLGNATDGQCVITMPKTVLNFASLAVPEDVMGTFDLPFRGLSTLTAGVPQNDAISMVWS